MASAFDDNLIKFGRTRADFQGNMLEWTRNTIMVADPGPSVAIMMSPISRIYMGLAWQGQKTIAFTMTIHSRVTFEKSERKWEAYWTKKSFEGRR